MHKIGPILRVLVAVSFLMAWNVWAGVPVIYSTDLFHPHDDPDDHFDLATLFALPELELKAVILDLGKKQMEKTGAVPLKQMFLISGRSVPYASGLGEKLTSPADDGRNQPAVYQGGVELLLKTLRESDQPMTVITAGSVRDICAAWNREPGLVKQKVGRLYLNIGTALDGASEWNVDLDPKAYVGILRSRLPIYLCFCNPTRPDDPNLIFSTWWHFRQSSVLETASQRLQNFFIYALQRPSPQELDPIRVLDMDLRPWHRLVWDMDRNMWCTAPFLHAAGRVTARVNGSWLALPEGQPGVHAETLYEFVPARVDVDENGRTRKDFASHEPNVKIFKVTQRNEYEEAMRDCLRGLLKDFPSR